MKNLVVLLFALVCLGNFANAQNFESLKDVEFSNNELINEYREQVSDCCYYVLQTPNDKKDAERKYAIEFVTRWMKKCQDCKFSISDNIRIMTEDREDLNGLFAISYASVYVEKKVGSKDQEESELLEMVITRFLNYCKEDRNKIKLTKQMKKVIEIKTNGEYSSLENVYVRN